MRRAGIALVAALIVACGGSSSPASPTANALATQTRTAELATLVTATPLPTATVQVVALPKTSYSGDVDVRELVKDVTRYANQPLRYRGSVLTIQVSAPDNVTVLQLQVTPYSGATVEPETLVVVFAGTTVTDGIIKGATVTVWLRPQQMATITNSFGAQVGQPLCAGDYIEPS